MKAYDSATLNQFIEFMEIKGAWPCRVAAGSNPVELTRGEISTLISDFEKLGKERSGE